MLDNFLNLSGKHSKSSKPKNSKKGESQEPEQPAKKSYRIPRVNKLLETDSDDDSLGQELRLPESSADKFSYLCNPMVRNLLKPDELLAPECNSLCKDFSRLVLYSATKQSWAKHCSAWKLYDEFCKSFGVRNSLSIKVEYARAFVTWAATKKHLKSSTIKSYISSLNMAHTISNVQNTNLTHYSRRVK